jgi:hypothetical protein
MIQRFAVLASLSALLAAPAAHAADRGVTKATVSGKTVTIDYGRPTLQGRDMLAQAQAGTAWRMGADDATSLKTETDLSFAGTAVPKGEYILTATKLEGGQWQLNVLSKERAKVADIPLEATKTPVKIEMLTIELAGAKDKGTFSMSWGDLSLGTAFIAK